MPFEPETDELLRRLNTVSRHGIRRLVALAGPPASGKSTLAENLAEAMPRACVVPMDGFHLDNRLLQNRGLLPRKGAPNTFDVSGFAHLVERLKSDQDVVYPIFDRTLDCAIAGAGSVSPDIETVLIEGNYLLLDAPVWRNLRGLWDFAVYLRVPKTILHARLMQRWHNYGFSKQDALTKVQNNDMPNALTTERNLMPADLILDTLS